MTELGISLPFTYSFIILFSFFFAICMMHDVLCLIILFYFCRHFLPFLWQASPVSIGLMPQISRSTSPVKASNSISFFGFLKIKRKAEIKATDAARSPPGKRHINAGTYQRKLSLYIFACPSVLPPTCPSTCPSCHPIGHPSVGPYDCP